MQVPTYSRRWFTDFRPATGVRCHDRPPSTNDVPLFRLRPRPFRGHRGLAGHRGPSPTSAGGEGARAVVNEAHGGGFDALVVTAAGRRATGDGRRASFTTARAPSPPADVGDGRRGGEAFEGRIRVIRPSTLLDDTRLQVGVGSRAAPPACACSPASGDETDDRPGAIRLPLTLAAAASRVRSTAACRGLA
jgi:hypothetical protein